MLLTACTFAVVRMMMMIVVEFCRCARVRACESVCVCVCVRGLNGRWLADSARVGCTAGSRKSNVPATRRYS